MNELLPLGTVTQWGPIEAIACFHGERYYFMYDGEVVSMMPATMVEEEEP